MPRFYKKKGRKKKEPENSGLNFELTFDDVTMSEVAGEFIKVKDLMEGEQPSTVTVLVNGRAKKVPVAISADPDDWCIRTRVTIVTPMGEGTFVLNCFNDGNVFIVGYSGNTSDPYYNPDIRCLTYWCQAAGWKVPQPSPQVVQDALSFWRHMWETLLVDSAYLDQRFGTRKSLDIRNQPVEEEDEEF